jgi:Putative transposase/Transposase zinc-binding domain
MCRPQLEVADIFRGHGPQYRRFHGASMPPEQWRVMRAIEFCRTAALGGHVDQCDQCGYRRISYNSCRNRHCPKCQSLAKAKWLQQRQAELLPIGYYHVVFTVPESIASVALQNKRVVYNILFRATSETLRTIASDPKHLGAEIGFLAVLHTWGQNLMHHPHLHCVVPGGGLSPDRTHWVTCRRKRFFLPVRVLSRMFRGKFLDYLKQAFDQGKLKFYGILKHLADRRSFNDLLQTARKSDWVVYAKRPFGGPAQVLDYLGRYTHRVAISNHRLLGLKDGKVTFRLKDYRQGNYQATMTLEAEEFIRRFLLHVLPSGFMRLRHFGFLGNRYRTQKLSLCRDLLNLGDSTHPQPEKSQDWKARYEALTGESLLICPACQHGRMVQVETIPCCWGRLIGRPRRKPAIDSS